MPRQIKEFVVRGETPATARGGVLAVNVELATARTLTGPRVPARAGGLPESWPEAGGVPSRREQRLVSTSWQTWKVAVGPSDKPRPFRLEVTSGLPSEVDHRFSAHFVPQ